MQRSPIQELGDAFRIESLVEAPRKFAPHCDLSNFRVPAWSHSRSLLQIYLEQQYCPRLLTWIRYAAAFLQSILRHDSCTRVQSESRTRFA